MGRIKEKVFSLLKIIIGLLVAIPLFYWSWNIALNTESPIRIKNEIRDPNTKEIECTFYVWIWQLGKIEEIAKQRCGGFSADRRLSENEKSIWIKRGRRDGREYVKAETNKISQLDLTQKSVLSTLTWNIFVDNNRKYGKPLLTENKNDMTPEGREYFKGLLPELVPIEDISK